VGVTGASSASRFLNMIGQDKATASVKKRAAREGRPFRIEVTGELGNLT